MLGHVRAAAGGGGERMLVCVLTLGSFQESSLLYMITPRVHKNMCNGMQERLYDMRTWSEVVHVYKFSFHVDLCEERHVNV